MNFVDNTGHTFSLQEYKSKPIGYEYNNQPYIFWIDDEHTKSLSINNYYCKVINLLIPVYPNISNANDTDFNCDIELNSNIYKLVSTLAIQNMINNKSSIQDLFDTKINISESQDLKTILTTDDLLSVHITQNNKNFVVVPMYIIGCAKEEGTWTSNILIHVYKKGEYDYVDESWTPITIGGVWTEQSESLIINGKNMGINLPNDIIKSIYHTSFTNDVFNENLYNQKLKEYLLNYMDIKGETGNFASAIKALKWFGYGNKITITKLLQTDNEFQKQYVRDFFDINNDMLKSFSSFRNSTLISLSMAENYETGNVNNVDFTKEFYGEGNPELISYFNTNVKVPIGNDFNNEDIQQLFYWKPYYDYCFYELGLKLSALKYYYEKYFLPIHLNINTASISHKEYTNINKMLIQPYVSTTQPISLITDDNDVSFPENNIQYFGQQIHYVDSNLNEFEEIDDNIDTYYINDMCLNIPIKFKKANKLYNCVLLLEKNGEFDGELVYETHFSVYQSNLKTTYKDFIVYPKIMHSTHLNLQTNALNNVDITSIGWWNNQQFTIKLLCNNRWYSYKFNTQLHDLDIEFGTLQYKYWNNSNNISSMFTQLKNIDNNSISFNAFMYEPNTVTVNHTNYLEDIIKYAKLSNLKYIDGELIKNNDFYHYIIYNTVKIRLSNKLFGKNISIAKDITADTYIDDNVLLQDYSNNNLVITEFTGELITLQYNIDLNCYIYNGNIYKVYEENHHTLEFLQDKYIEQKNIVGNSNYLNRMHVFDIMQHKNIVVSSDDFSIFRTNSELKYDGITLSHGYATDKSVYITGSFDERLGDIDEEHLNTTNTFTKHVDIYNEFNSNVIELTTSYGYYENVITGELTTSPWNYNDVHVATIEYNTLSDFKTNKVNNILDITDTDEIHVYNSTDTSYYYTVNKNNGDINRLSFTVDYKYFNNGVWLNNYYPSAFEINDFINSINNDDNNYKLTVSFTKKAITTGAINIYHDVLPNSITNNNYIVEQNGILTYNGIELITRDEIRYYDKDNKRFINPNYPSLYWYDTENGVVIDNNINDVHQTWTDLTYTDISTSYENDFNNSQNQFVTSVEINTGEYELSCTTNTTYVRLLYGFDDIHYNSFSLNTYEDNKIVFTDNYVLAYENDNWCTEHNMLSYTKLYGADTKRLYIAIELDKYESDGITPIDYTYIQAEIQPTIKHSTVTDTYERLKYVVPTNVDETNSITINNYKYETNVSQQVVDLYNDFFYKQSIDNNMFIKTSRGISISNTIDYDFYLMHDEFYWYGIYISKDVIGNYSTANDLIYQNSNNKYDLKTHGLKTGNEYYFKYIKSDNEFLINRMQYISNNGNNNFSQDNVIVSSIKNNSHLPFNFNISAQWEVKPLSIGIKNTGRTTANTEMAIINIPEKNNLYEKGYYDVSVKYSLDTETNDIITKHGIIKINGNTNDNRNISDMILNSNSFDRNINEQNNNNNINAVIDMLNKEQYIRIDKDYELLNILMSHVTIVYDDSTYITGITPASDTYMVAYKIDNSTVGVRMVCDNKFYKYN